MIFTYFFEAKSIQSYLFRTGKLKDVIAASERLDNLIDDTSTSLLSRVLETCQLSSDLHNHTQQNVNELIRFVRVKGGAFYASCSSEEPLLQLRSSWTLLLQQLFPSLEFIDAMTHAASLQGAIEAGQQKLAEDRNSPSIKFPLASAITDRCARTGCASVPISVLAAKAFPLKNDGDKTLDRDTELHRQAYQALGMKDDAALQDKFTPIGLKGKVKYPVNLDKDFQFGSKSLPVNREAIKDIALIHIDGNGLGIILRELQQALKDVTDDEYRKTFRAFSSALSLATQAAAQQATQWLYDAALTDEEKRNSVFIPMRPIVLGGDDITLLCRADLALEYSKRFCKAFKNTSEEALKLIHSQLKKQTTKSYLTASGGILYHKAGHPFTHSHHLVEGLCLAAKSLSKKVGGNNIGPAALSFYRLSNAVSADVQQLIQQSQCFPLGDPADKIQMNLGFNTYLVESESCGEPSFADIERCVALSNSSSAAVSMKKWRNIATQLAMGNKSEAKRLYSRAVEISRAKNSKQVDLEQKALHKVANYNDSFEQWYWSNADGQLQTVISDLLIIEHFSNKGQTDIGSMQEANI